MKALFKMSRKIYYTMNDLIGNEEVIQKRRLVQRSNNKPFARIGIQQIPSGSKAEGLDLIGSDVDVMYALDHLRVYTLDFPNIVPDNQEILLYANTLDTTVHPGYVIIKGFNCYSRKYIGILKSSDFVSKYLIPMIHPNFILLNLQRHGPCLTTYFNESESDIAFCLPSHEWPLVAQEWPLRKREQNWPNQDLIQTVVKEGCLFVPIGYEANSDSDTDWRISFSKAEKRLVFSFNHVQMLIYGLLKLFLKEVVNTESSVNGLLCSYFMKTILFWTIEESPSTLWVPNNFMLCFWKCFIRLIFCVENKICPHYFIKHVNLFQKKITNDSKKRLLEVLQPLKITGIHCLYRSKTLQIMSTKTKKTGAAHMQRQLDIIRMDEVCQYSYTIGLCYGMGKISNAYYDPFVVFLGRTFRSWMTGKTVIRELYPIVKKQMWQNSCHLIDFSKCKDNKYCYMLRQLFLHFLIAGSKTDAVAGKLQIAAWLYKNEKYKQCLFVVEQALENVKRTFYYNKAKVMCLQSDSEIEKQSGGLNVSFADKVRFFLISDVFFPLESQLLPDELKIPLLDFKRRHACCFPPMLIQPDLFGHFLRVLCYHKLEEKTQTLCAISDIKQLGPILPNDPIFSDAYKCQHFIITASLRNIVDEGNNQSSTFLDINQTASGIQNEITKLLKIAKPYLNVIRKAIDRYHSSGFFSDEECQDMINLLMST